MRYSAVAITCLLLLSAATAIRLHETPGSDIAKETAKETLIAQPSDPLIRPISIEFLKHDFAHDRTAEPHGHGENMCASGCAASRHPTAPLSADAFRQLLLDYQQIAPTGDNEALEKILFHGRQSRNHWKIQRAASIDPLWRMVLDEELQKTHVLISLRILDESGRVRSGMSHIRVPLDRRHVFEMEREGLQPLVTSGTVKRVGLDHLWTRL